MRKLALIVALVATAASAFDVADVIRPRDGRGMWRARGGVSFVSTGSADPFPAVLSDFTFPTALSAAQRVPACADGSEGACRFCAVGAFDGGQQWQCVSEDGGHPVVIVDPGGGVVPSFIPGLNARTFVTGTDWVQMFEDGGLLDTFEKDGGTVVIAGYSRGGPSGFDYWLEDDPAGAGGPWFLLRASSGQMTWFMGAQGVNPANGFQAFDETNHNGWGVFSLRYTGGPDAGLGAPYVMNVGPGLGTSGTGAKLGQAGGPTPGHAFNSPWYVGGRPTNDLWLNGSIAYIWIAPGERSDDWIANNTARYFGMPNADAGWAGRFIPSNYRLGVDNTAQTGNVDFVNGFVVEPTGLSGQSAAGTNWTNGNDVFDAGWNRVVGGAFVTANVSSGPFSTFLNAPECDRITAPVAGAGIVTLDAGISALSNWWDFSVYAKASDAGAVTNVVQLFLRSDGTMPDGGHEQDCLYTLSYDAGRFECRARFDGGSYVLAGAEAWDAGSFEICQSQFTNSPALLPPIPDSTLRTGAGFVYAAAPSNWPNPDAGGAYELVQVVPYDPNGDWSTVNDVLYPYDMGQAKATYPPDGHSLVFAYGYTAPGIELIVDRDGTANVSDVEIPNVSLLRGHSLATRVEITPLGGNKCTTVIKQKDCGVMPSGLSYSAANAWIHGCKADTGVIGAVTNPDAGCPANLGWVTFGARNNGSVPSDNTVQAVRRLGK